MINIIVAVFFSYFIGSIPFGFIFGKILKKVDIRSHGSGNVGATNVIRVVGTIPGIIVFILDVLKGIAAVTVIYSFFYLDNLPLQPVYFKILLASAVISGHNWTVFLQFKGGKGVATSAGVMLALAPKAVLISSVVWALVFIFTRIVSVSSIAASVSLPVFMVVLDMPLPILFFGVIGCLFIVYKHRSNIRRLIEGEENKIYFKKR